MAVCLGIAFASGAVVACGSDPAREGAGIGMFGGTGTTEAGKVEDFKATSKDFTNIHDMTPVRGFFVDNKSGHLAEAVAMAKANKGGVYPVGTILQLVPQEAMVKRRPGWNAATKDWEFFFLDVTPQGTEIVTRGADQVVNRFGANCASCHQAAKPRFDFVCENSHGCDALPIDHKVIEGIQEADPRPLLG